MACLGGLLLPTPQQAQQRSLIQLDLLERCRSIPGTSPATSHADWLISRTAIRVLSGLRTVWDRLGASGSGMGHSVVLPSDDGRARQLRVKILDKGELIDKPRFL